MKEHAKSNSYKKVEKGERKTLKFNIYVLRVQIIDKYWDITLRYYFYIVHAALPH